MLHHKLASDHMNLIVHDFKLELNFSSFAEQLHEMEISNALLVDFNNLLAFALTSANACQMKAYKDK